MHIYSLDACAQKTQKDSRGQADTVLLPRRPRALARTESAAVAGCAVQELGMLQGVVGNLCLCCCSVKQKILLKDSA